MATGSYACSRERTRASRMLQHPSKSMAITTSSKPSFTRDKGMYQAVFRSILHASILQLVDGLEAAQLPPGASFRRPPDAKPDSLQAQTTFIRYQRAFWKVAATQKAAKTKWGRPLARLPCCLVAIIVACACGWRFRWTRGWTGLIYGCSRVGGRLARKLWWASRRGRCRRERRRH